MTNYLDVISSWCHWAIPAWQELRDRYSDRVDFQWKIALMDKTGLPPTQAHTEWYYRRSGILMRSPRMLKASWVEPNATEYLAPNCVAEAARDFGVEDDRVWIALSRAELLRRKEDRALGRRERSRRASRRTGFGSPAPVREIAGDRSARPQEHGGISRIAGDAAANLRDRFPNWRPRGFLGICQSRSHGRNARRDVGRYRRVRGLCRAFRRSAALRAEFWPGRSRLPPAQKRLASLAMSVTTSPRFGRYREPVDALLAGAKISECGALPGARREIATIGKTASVSLPRRRPGDNSFCNHKFV